MLGGEPYHVVLIPTAPVPIGGGLIYVPAKWVKPADIGIEGLMSIYVAMGVTSRQPGMLPVPIKPPAVSAPTPAAPPTPTGTISRLHCRRRGSSPEPADESTNDRQTVCVVRHRSRRAGWRAR